MKFSVITPCLNRERFLTEAIESVLGQEYPEIEHWVIDGGSTDRTLEILAKYPHLNVISEPDRGVYDALNKGLERATGEAILFLNTDDLLVPGTLNLCADVFRNALGTQIISGGCQIFQTTERGREIEMHRYENARRYGLSLKNVTLGLPIINARIFRRAVFEKIGRFDLAYPIASDREFLIRAALAGLPDAPISRITYRYRWHADSLTMNAGNSSLLQAITDGLAMIESTVAKYALSDEDLRTLESWRRELEATKVMIQAVRKEGGPALSSAITSFVRDPRWLLTFVRCGFMAVGRRARTKYRTLRAQRERVRP